MEKGAGQGQQENKDFKKKDIKTSFLISVLANFVQWKLLLLLHPPRQPGSNTQKSL
jgi:hypothetical protein